MAVTVAQTKVTININCFETDATEALTFDAPVAVGGYIVVAFSTGGNRDVTSVTDDGGNTYELLNEGGTSATEQNATSAHECWIYGAQVTTQASTVTVVVSSAVTGPSRMAILALTGQHASTPVEDVVVYDNAAAADTTHPIGPVVTAAAGNILVGVLAGSTGSYTDEVGWNTIDDTANSLISWKAVGAASTTWTATTSAGESAAGALVAIKPVGAGGTDLSVVLGEPVIGGSLF